MYIANHYVKVNGVTFTPGEFITEEMTSGMARRLLMLEAIRKAAEAPIAEAKRAADERDKEADNGGAEGNGGGENATEGDGEDSENEDSAEDSEDEADEEYEEAEPMEIDVSDSITPAAEAETTEKKPARKRRGGKEGNA